MKQMKLEKGSIEYQFAVESIKYFVNTRIQRYVLKQIFRQFQTKTKSEYREDKKKTAEIWINERKLDAKKTLIIEVNDDFSIIEDSKLNSKSLMLKYFEHRVQDSEYTDTINTLNILIESLEEEINISSWAHSCFKSLTNKNLIKLMDPEFFDEYQKDEFDLSYHQLIQYQLSLIQYIAEKNVFYENIIILLDLLEIDEMILSGIKNLKNCISIVFVDDYKEFMPLDSICLIENRKIYDFSDEDLLYRIVTKKHKEFYTIEEAKNKMKQELYRLKKIGIVNDSDNE